MDSINIWMIYLYGIYPNVIAFLTISMVVLFISIPFLVIFNEEVPEYSKKLKIVIIGIMFIGLLSTLMPSRNILVAMFALEPVKNIAHNISESNKTKLIIDSVDNYLLYIHKKSEELINKE